MLESLAGEVNSKARENAANTVECAPKIGRFAMRVVQNDGRGIELLRESDAALEAQPFALRARRNPREREVGYEMVVVVQPADIAMATRKEHFDHLAFVAFERNVLEELACLVARDSMSRPSHIARTICRNIKSNGRINRVPESKIDDIHTKLVEPCREMPSDKRPAREAEEEHVRRNAIFRQRLIVRLEPSPRVSKCRPPIDARDLPCKIRAKMRSRARLKMEFLPRIVHAQVAKPRYVGDLARNALPRPLEK